MVAFLIFFARARSPYDLETWHAAPGTQALQNLINDDPGLTLTYFTAESNWATYSFEWGKLLQSHLIGKTCSKVLNWLINEFMKKLNQGGPPFLNIPGLCKCI